MDTQVLADYLHRWVPKGLEQDFYIAMKKLAN
jgi:hypothetical protein